MLTLAAGSGDISYHDILYIVPGQPKFMQERCELLNLETQGQST